MKLAAAAVKILVILAPAIGAEGCDFVLDNVVFRPETLARLDAGRQRSIVITRETFCDQGCNIYCEIRDAGGVLRDRGYIDTDDGRVRHAYSLLTAEGGDLVGVVDRTEGFDPLIVFDFAGDRSSVDLPQADASYEQELAYQRQLVDRLRRENPQVPAPAP